MIIIFFLDRLLIEMVNASSIKSITFSWWFLITFDM